MKTANYIDLLKKRNNWSDAEIGRQLSKSKQAVSNWRHNNIEMDDDTCILVANALEIEPLVVLAHIHAARSKSKTAKKIWQQIASSAAVITLTFGTSQLSPQPTDITNELAKQTSQVSILC